MLARCPARAAAALTLAIALLAGAGAGTAAAAPLFKASVYGIQRYVNTSSHQPVGEPHCLDTRGSLTEGSTLKFTSMKPVTLRVSARRGAISLTRVGRGGTHLFDVRATFEAEGVNLAQRFDCQSESWVDADDWEAPPCPATTVDDLGIDLSSPGRGRLAVAGGQELAPLDPIDCLWGDRSFELYPASSRVDAGELLGGGARETELVLRGRQVDAAKDPGSEYRRVRRSTVYLTLKRIG